MASLKTKLIFVATVVAATAGVAAFTVAHADVQYKADRTYCMSGAASEARDLCLKEAAAAQAERQRGSHPAAAHPTHRSAKQAAPAASEKSASSP